MKKEADITVLYHEGAEDASRFLVLETDGEGRALDMALCPKRSPSRKFGMEMYILERELLIALLESAEAQGGESFVMDILLRNRGNLRLYGWQYEGPIWHIDSVNAYFACNMDMLREEIQTALFRKEEKIYTKVKNRVPARYGGDADIRRCIVADGCILEGYAENCIFFRGAKLARRAHLQNCIVMEKTHIDVGARAENVIFDKECLLREGRSLAGGENYPLIIQKGAII